MSTFSGSPLLTIAYDASGLAPTAIYYLDPSGNAVALASTVDAAAHTITAALEHFSDYVAGTPAAAAAPTPTVTWVGTTGGDWNTPSKWSTGAVPKATDDVYIGLAAGQAVTIASGAVTVNTLTCDCDLTVNSGASLTVSNQSQINGKLTLAGGAVGGPGAITVSVAFDVTVSNSALNGTGVFTTQGTSTVNTPAGGGFLALVGGKSWVNQGSLTISGDERLLFGFSSGGSNSLTNAVGATLSLASSSATPLDFWTGSASVTNLGTLNLTVAGAHAIASQIAFGNSGTVNVQVGRLTVGGGSTETGVYAVAAGATLEFVGGTRNLQLGSDVGGAGTLVVSGGTVNANASLAIAATGAALNVSGGALNVNTSAVSGLLAPVTLSGGVLSFNSAAVVLPSLTLSGGALGGTAAVTVIGRFDVTVSNSALSGTGVFTTQGATTVSTPSGGGFLALVGGKSWVNQGSATISGDERLLFGFSTGGSNSLTNAAGATLSLASSSATPLDFWTGTASVTNLGTLNSSVAGSHAVATNIAFANGGTVNVTAGTLTVRAGGTDTGLYSVAAGATLNFSGGTRNLEAGSDVGGAGTLVVSGGTVTANASLGIAAAGAALSVSGGALNVNTSAVSGLLAPVTVSGGVLSFNGAAVSLPTLVLSGGTLGGTASVTVTGRFDVTVSNSALSGTGVFTTQGTSTVSTPSGGGFLALVGGKSWVNSGSLTISGDERLLFGFSSGGANSLTNVAGATLTLASSAAAPLDFWTGTASVANLGTINFTVAGTHAVASQIAFGNGGTVDVQVGRLTVGGGTDTGVYSVAAGATLEFVGGTRNLGAGSDVGGAGTLVVSGGTVTANGSLGIAAAGAALSVSGGALNVNTSAVSGLLAPVTVSGGVLSFNGAAVSLPSLVLGGGTLAGTASVTVTGRFDVTVSNSGLSGTGVFTTQGASTVSTPSGGGFLSVIGGRSWVNQGTLTIAGDERLLFGFSSGGSNSLTNAAGATLNLATSAATPLDFWTGTASVTNLGTFVLTVAGTHTIASQIAFGNGGTVDVQAGKLTVGGGGTDTGAYSVATATTLDFAGGTRNFQPGTTVTGAGTLSVSGAIANVNGSLDLAATTIAVVVSGGSLNVNGQAALATLTLAGGTLGGAGAVTVTGRFDVTGTSALSGTGVFTTQGASTVNIPSTNGLLAVVG
ncbi:MAG TPA: hypothetical protein VGJ77_07535, partial [Gaiellaceae bacterium]